VLACAWWAVLTVACEGTPPAHDDPRVSFRAACFAVGGSGAGLVFVPAAHALVDTP